jgi:hypothetical protein
MLLLLHFTRGMQRTPLLSSKHALRLVKRSHTSISTVISFLMEIFRRLNAAFVAFHTRNTTHASFSFETSPAARKTPPCVDNERIFIPDGDISSFKRRFVAFHTRNTTHASFSFETSPAARKTPPYVDNKRIFFPVGDISKFERCFCCISHEECNAQHFYLRNKPSGS